MAKEITGYVKLQIKGGQANPAPPVGPALLSCRRVLNGVLLVDRRTHTNLFSRVPDLLGKTPDPHKDPHSGISNSIIHAVTGFYGPNISSRSTTGARTARWFTPLIKPDDADAVACDRTGFHAGGARAFSAR